MFQAFNTRCTSADAYVKTFYTYSNLPSSFSFTNAGGGTKNEMYLYDVNNQRIYKHATTSLGSVFGTEFYLRDALGREIGILDMHSNAWNYYLYGNSRFADITPIDDQVPSDQNDEISGYEEVSQENIENVQIMNALKNSMIANVEFPIRLAKVIKLDVDSTFWVNDSELENLNAEDYEVVADQSIESLREMIPMAEQSTGRRILASVGEIVMDTNFQQIDSTSFFNIFDPYNHPYRIMANTLPNELHFWVFDHLGNTRVVYAPEVEIINTIPDITYNIKGAYDYFSYGKILRTYIEGQQDRFLSTTNERDPFTGFDFRNARYYDSDLSKFMSVDPLADEPEQVDKSPYAYGWNNPIKYNDPDGKFPSCLFGALVGAAVEYGSQVAANVYEGKGLQESLTDIDLGDVAISAGEGFLTSGTSAVRSLVGKAVVTVGAEVIRNSIDVKKDGVKVNDAKSVVRNTAVGLTTAGVTKVLPSPNVKVKAEISPKQAVKAARETGVVNRAGRERIEKTASSSLKEAKAINKTASGAPTRVATGAASESTKRKGDKTYGNGN